MPDVPGSDQALRSCPPLPDADSPLGPIPPRDPLCGENDMELAGDIYLRSNAYRRLSTIYGPDVAVSLIGNNHYQLRDHAVNLILGEDRSTLHHVPFGSEIPAPQGNASNLTPHEQAIRAGMSRVTVGVMQGVVYTGDLTDMSAYLTTPIGSLAVQAPGTGPDPLQPGPGGERQLQLLNNFQVLDTQVCDGQYPDPRLANGVVAQCRGAVPAGHRAHLPTAHPLPARQRADHPGGSAGSGVHIACRRADHGIHR
ncbi:hypothetical protein ACFYUD_28470 [Nocardia tengchongensis]|uniref:hypothetical protein n=1 Tax=Nocardia tengchongensis TaxID=2055889 RepID=UPI00367CBFC2